MNTFNSFTDKLDFLKKYNFLAKTKTELPTLYYYAPYSDIPKICEVIGYEQIFETWAIIVIKIDDTIVNIHSTYLLEMKERGAAYYRNEYKKTNIKNNAPSDPDNSYIVFDLETTGLNCKTDEIIEIAALKFTNDNVYEFHEFVKIDSIIPINATLVNGISNETIADADYIDIVMPKFLSFIENYKLVGHNIKTYDIPLIKRVCRELRLHPINNELVDTLYLARKALPELDNHKLTTLCDYYDIDTSNAHHALSDCYMCDNIYRILTSDSIEITVASSPFQEKLLSILKKIIIEKELPDKGLRIRENRNKNADSYSILISEPPYPTGSERLGGEQSIMKITPKSNSYDLDILLNTFDNIPYPDNTSYKKLKQNGNNPQHVIVSFSADSLELYPYIESVVLYRLALYRTAESTFSCCSKFNQCSDAKKCIHENKLYSTACTYRRNLESDRIFYGKNRNID